MKENDLQSCYTLRFTETIAESYVMLPCDWKALNKSIMIAAQYSMWWIEYSQLCENQVQANIINPA